MLTEVLRSTDTDSVLVFTRTKHRANKVAQQLCKIGMEAGVLHANKSQNHRQQTLDDFRSGKVRLLVATDIAARGIDVSSISHVVNYDIPDCADSYIHRIGRTGRMERSGEAITFIIPADAPTIKDIEKTLGERIPTRTIENFDYNRPAPKNDDEFKRDPRPPRRAIPAPKAITAQPPVNYRSTRRAGRPPRESKPLIETQQNIGENELRQRQQQSKTVSNQSNSTEKRQQTASRGKSASSLTLQNGERYSRSNNRYR